VPSGRFGRVGLVRIRVGSVAVAVERTVPVDGVGIPKTEGNRLGFFGFASQFDSAVAVAVGVGAVVVFETSDSEMQRPSIDSVLRRVPIATMVPTNHPVFLGAKEAERIDGFLRLSCSDQRRFLSSSIVPATLGPRSRGDRGAFEHCFSYRSTEGPFRHRCCCQHPTKQHPPRPPRSYRYRGPSPVSQRPGRRARSMVD
jgi:hypothetical protein